MNDGLITLGVIKTLVENVSGVENLSKRSRKRFIVDCRTVYYVLSRKFTGHSLDRIGGLLNRNHATVLNGLRSRHLIGEESFYANSIYDRCYEELVSLRGRPMRIMEFYDVNDVKDYYRIKHIQLTEKTHKVIANYRRKLDTITTNETIREILRLDFEDFEEFEDKFKVFFKVKRLMKKELNSKKHIKTN